MKKALILAGLLASLAAAQTKFVADIEAPLLDPASRAEIGKVYEGTPVEVVKEEGEFALVEIKGEISASDPRVLAFKSAPILTFASFEASPQKGARYLVKSSFLADDAGEAWSEIETLYYDTCSSCHAAHKPKEHEAGEWEALLTAMQVFAKTSDEETARILRYVQAYAKDGIVKE